jgi:ferritin-like metal-binding protein YciE
MEKNNRKTHKPSAHSHIGRSHTRHSNFHKLFLEEMQELYSIETLLIDELPKMAQAASSPELKQTIKEHLKETQHQLKRLEQSLHRLEIKGSSNHSQGMKRILKDGEEMVAQHEKSATKDAAIISAAQKIEHYEIAAYGSAKAHAKCLDFTEIADLLDESLDEEVNAEKKLTKLAEGSMFASGINKQASVEEEAYAHA